MLSNTSQTFCFMDFETTGIDTSVYMHSLPIEIGCIFTDEKFNILERFATLIAWPEIIAQTKWDAHQMNAYNVHKIDLIDIKRFGMNPQLVKNILNQICKSLPVESKFRPIIISDNPYFEMAMLKFLYLQDIIPFHYSAWNTMLVLNLANVKRTKKPHQAYKDALLLYEDAKMAYQILRKK